MWMCCESLTPLPFPPLWCLRMCVNCIKLSFFLLNYIRIHYPLPLPYVGKPDPVQLQETIRKLREENQRLKEQVKFKKWNIT